MIDDTQTNGEETPVVEEAAEETVEAPAETEAAPEVVGEEEAAV